MVNENLKISIYDAKLGETFIRDLTSSEINDLKRSIGEIKETAVNTVYSICEKLRTKVAGTTDQVKIASWANYRMLAQAYYDGTINAFDLNSIDSEIKLRGLGESRSEFFAKVKQNATQYTFANGVITGSEKRAINKILSSTTEQDVNLALNDLSLNLAGFSNLDGFSDIIDLKSIMK